MSGFVNFSADQSPKNRWAAALDALSVGLGKIGEMHERREQEEMKETRMDHREAAQRAFQDNLARFTQTQENDRLTQSLGSEEKREHERTTTASEDRKLAREQHDSDHEDQVRHEKAMEGLEASRIGSENSRADTAAARADAAEKRAGQTADRDRAATALKSTEADLRASIDQKRDLEKQLADPMMKFDKTGQADTLRSQLGDLNKDIHGLQTDLRSLRSQAGYASSTDTSGGAGGAAKLAPDRQQLYDDLKSRNPDKDPSAILDHVKSMKQTDIDTVMKLRPTADTSTGGATPAPGAPPAAGGGGFMDGVDPSTATASTAAPQSGMPEQPAAPDPGADAAPDALNSADPAGADQQFNAQNSQAMASTDGAPDPGTAPPDTGQGEDVGTETQNNDEQFGQMSQQLQQSPEGQGVHATLDRLAQTDNPVQQGKLQRQAELQLQDMFPDQDPAGYIDWYTSQQQQEPEFT